MANLKTVLDLSSTLNVRLDKVDKEAALLRTALGGPNSELKLLIEMGADFSARLVANGATALHLAAGAGRVDAIETLLDSGFDIEERNIRNSETALHTAVRNGYGEAVWVLIRRGARIDAKDSNGDTALTSAAMSGNVNIVEALIILSPNLETKDGFGHTALYNAVECGHGKIVQLLIKKGADFRKKDISGWTPLHRAACSGDAETVRILLENGADANEKDIGGRTALVVAKDHGQHSAAEILQEHAQRDRYAHLQLASPGQTKVTPSVGTIPNDYSPYATLDQGNDEIRLVRIELFPRESRFACSIVRTSLQDHPPFTALSYCWGSLENTVPISLGFGDDQKVDSSWINNGSTRAQEPRHVVTDFKITTNLYEALLSFQHHTDYAFIWTDMLCINQGNLSERSQQVAIMSSIYKEAASVTVWLGGDPKANSDVLFHDEAEDLDIFVKLLQKHSSSEDQGLAQQWATMCSSFSEKDEYDDSDWNDITDWTFEIPYKSVAKDLYLMYSSMPEETTELIRTRKLKRPINVESYFYDTILHRNSLVLRLATFLSLDHESQFDIKHEVSWQNLFHVLQRWHKIIFSPWFGRVWVVREIVNNETVRVRHCNTQTDWNLVLNYHLIYKALNSAWSDRPYRLTILLPNFSMYFRDGLMQWYSLWENIDSLKQKQLSFWRILIATNDFLSTDPKDKIYALAPLASEINAEELVPDYSKSVEWVFSTFTQSYIQKQESLKLLSLCRHFHQKELTSEKGFRCLENLPSWTPDYGKIPYLQICVNADSTSLYSADGEQPAKIIYDEDNPASLHVEGVSVARVVNVIEVQGDGFWAQPWSDIKDLGPSPFKPKQSNTTDRVSVMRKNYLTLERYFQTLSASVTVGPPQLAVFAQMALDINTTYFMKTSWSEAHFLRKCNTEVYHPLELSRRFQLYTVAITDNNLFVSHDNRLGLGPKEMKEGDLVVILSGSGVPFILREKKLRENATREELEDWLQCGPVYQLIGECYLDGRMHGEIFEDPLFEDPLHIDPLDHDSLLYPDLEGGKKGEQGRKGVYRAKMFHLQ